MGAYIAVSTSAPTSSVAHCAVQAEDAQASGRLCILPLLLQAVLPHCGQAAVLDMLRTLCRDSPQGPAWAVDYPQVRHHCPRCILSPQSGCRV